jgi:hypothetical protein
MSLYLEVGTHAVHDVWCIIGTSTMIVAWQFQHFFYAKYFILFSKKSKKIRKKQIKRNIHYNILQSITNLTAKVPYFIPRYSQVTY